MLTYFKLKTKGRLKMIEGLTRAEILQKMPNLKKGSFDLYCAKAGIKAIAKRPSKNSHVLEFVYPINTIEKIKKITKNC